MPKLAAFADIKQTRVEYPVPGGYTRAITSFFPRPDNSSVDMPMAFLADGSPGRILRTHYHHTDQFQVIILGDGFMGSHKLGFGGVHFARAYTPYGPTRYGEAQGLGFLTLRAHVDMGANYMPENREALDAVPDRAPWQVSAMPDLALVPDASGVAMKPIEGMKDDHGLGGWSVVLRTGASITTTDLSRGEGQFVVVLRGGIMDGADHRLAPTVIFMAKGEGSIEVKAGPEGATLLILNFPDAAAARRSGQEAAGMGQHAREATAHECVLCGFVYKDASGEPHAGITPGTRWADVPESFQCPDCDAGKADFTAVENTRDLL